MAAKTNQMLDGLSSQQQRSSGIVPLLFIDLDEGWQFLILAYLNTFYFKKK